jgi:hypothetical protein
MTPEGERLYREANEADNAYSAACLTASGGKRDRWTLKKKEERSVAVCAARQAFWYANRRWLDWMRANPTGGK